MVRLLKFINGNKTTTAMLLFVALFYGISYIAHHTTRKSTDLSQGGGELSWVPASKSVKQREAVFRERLEEMPGLVKGASLTLFGVIVTGLLLNLYFFSRKLSGNPLIAQSYSHQKVPWGLMDLLQVYVFLFFAEAMILIAEIALSIFFDIGPLHSDFFLMLNSLLRNVCVAALVIFLVIKRFREPLGQIGLTTRDFARNVARGIVGYVAVVPVLLLVFIIISVLSQLFRYEPPPQQVVQIYLKETADNNLIFFTFFVVIIGPIIEEIFFRGFTYKALRSRFGVRRGLVVSALIFAALHANFIVFIPIFVLGYFLTYLYEKTGSLVPSMTVHMAHNLIMVFLTLSFKSLSS